MAAFISYALSRAAQPHPPWESLDVTHPRFDIRRAYGDLAEIARGCPSRLTGSPGARCAADFIEKRFRALELPTRTQHFPVWMNGKRVPGVNVFAMVSGTSRRPLLVVAHYDAAATSPEAAADNASGTAALLELARIFSTEQPKRTLVFLASDAGVWGSAGTDVFARDAAWTSLPGIGDSAPYAALSLDHLAPGGAAGVIMQGGGQARGFAPRWLLAKVAAGISAAGVRVSPEGPIRQITARAVPIVFTDQGVLQKRGIPAVNLSTAPADAARARRMVRTAADTLAEIQPGALRVFGISAESALRAVLGAGVTDSPDVVTFSPRRSMRRSDMRIISGLLFLPLGVLVLGALFRRRPGPAALLRAAAWALPVAAAALAMRFSVSAGLLPRFSLSPATPGDPFLTTWQPPAMLAAAAAAGLGLWAARAITRRRGGHAPDAGRLLLLTAAAWAWARNDLAAAIFLAPAAWAWPWLGAIAGRGGRARDAVLLALGLAPFLLLLALAAERLFLGPWILWYGLLLEGYGVLPVETALIAGLAFAAAVALLRAPRAGSPSETA